jgi:hypothetical protein
LTDIFSELQFSWRCPKTETKSTRYSKNSGKKKPNFQNYFGGIMITLSRMQSTLGRKTSRAAQEKTVNTV